MEKNYGIVYALVCLVVIVLVVATVAIPVVESTSKTLSGVEQNTSARYMMMSTDDEIVLSYDSGPVYNGEAWNPDPVGTGADVSYIITDKLIVRSNYNSGWSSWSVMYDNNGTGTSVTITGSATVTFSGGTVTYSSDGVNTTYEAEYSYLWAPSENGTYGAWSVSSDLPIYIDSSSMIYFASFGGSGSFSVGHGKLSDLHLDMSFYSGASTASTAVITATYTPTSYNASNELTAFSISGGSFGGSGYVFAPIEYTTLTEQQSILTTMLAIVPILLLFIPIMVMVRMFQGRRE